MLKETMLSNLGIDLVKIYEDVKMTDGTRLTSSKLVEILKG